MDTLTKNFLRLLKMRLAIETSSACISTGSNAFAAGSGACVAEAGAALW